MYDFCIPGPIEHAHSTQGHCDSSDTQDTRPLDTATSPFPGTFWPLSFQSNTINLKFKRFALSIQSRPVSRFTRVNSCIVVVYEEKCLLAQWHFFAAVPQMATWGKNKQTGGPVSSSHPQFPQQHSACSHGRCCYSRDLEPMALLMNAYGCPRKCNATPPPPWVARTGKEKTKTETETTRSYTGLPLAVD